MSARGVRRFPWQARTGSTSDADLRDASAAADKGSCGLESTHLPIEPRRPRVKPAGSRLGPYEIHTSIGVGGMGEVYRATDTRLDRLVAIKVICAPAALDPAFRERFAREARAISSLDHPNICTL